MAAQNVAKNPGGSAVAPSPLLRAAAPLSSLSLFLLICLVWEAAFQLHAYPTYTLSSPQAVAESLVVNVLNGSLISAAASSMEKVLLGYFAAIAIGIPLGMALSVKPWLRSAVRPLLRFVYPIPGIAWVPLTILWFGVGMTSAVVVIAFSCIFPVVIATMDGLASVDQQYLRVLRIFGTPALRGFWRVRIPAALPQILTGLRLAYGVGWRVIIGVEIISSGSGLGYLIDQARWQMRADIAFAGMIVIGLIGLVVERYFFDWLESVTIRRWGMRGA